MLDGAEAHRSFSAAFESAAGVLRAGRNFHPLLVAGGRHLHMRAADIDDQNSHAITPLVVCQSAWRERLRHCLEHHFFAEKRWAMELVTVA